MRLRFLLAAAALACQAAGAQTRVELSGHYTEAESGGALGTQLGDRADLKSAGAYVGVVQNFHPNIAWEFGVDFGAVKASDTLSSDYHKTNSVGGGIRFNSTGPVQGFVRLGGRANITQEKVRGITYKQTGGTVYIAPGLTFVTASGPAISLWALVSSVYSPAASDAFAFRQFGVTICIPID